MDIEGLKISLTIGVCVSISAWVLYRVFSLILGFSIPFETWQSEAAIFVIMAIVIIILFVFGIASNNEKEKTEAVSRFSDEEKALRQKIEAEKDKEKKKALKQQALELRQEYDSLMSENLRRIDGEFVTDWRESLLVTRRRLIDEEQRLLARNRANLSFGILMALVGVALPASYIVIVGELKPSDSFGTFVANYWPFFTIAVIIEIIAIFFLGLYSSNERRLERNKNDLTNIELRLTAGLMLYDKTNKTKFAVLSDTLSKEESNVVLGKNESSGGISADKVMGILSKLILRGGT